MTRRKRRLRRPYPHNRDIAEAMMRVLSKKPWVKPMDFPNEVRRELEEGGFYVGLVSDKRIWRIYLDYVSRGWLYDYLGVVSAQGQSLEYE